MAKNKDGLTVKERELKKIAELQPTLVEQGYKEHPQLANLWMDVDKNIITIARGLLFHKKTRVCKSISPKRNFKYPKSRVVGFSQPSEPWTDCYGRVHTTQMRSFMVDRLYADIWGDK